MKCANSWIINLPGSAGLSKRVTKIHCYIRQTYRLCINEIGTTTLVVKERKWPIKNWAPSINHFHFRLRAQPYILLGILSAPWRWPITLSVNLERPLATDSNFNWNENPGEKPSCRWRGGYWGNIQGEKIHISLTWRLLSTVSMNERANQSGFSTLSVTGIKSCDSSVLVS